MPEGTTKEFSRFIGLSVAALMQGWRSRIDEIKSALLYATALLLLQLLATMKGASSPTVRLRLCARKAGFSRRNNSLIGYNLKEIS